LIADCLMRCTNPAVRPDVASRVLLLSTEESRDNNMESSTVSIQFKGSGQWEALEYYLVITSPVLCML
jgi:hypothetical protein